MSRIAAITGKGGSGKTTVTALLIRHLIRNGLGPVLAVDADPNSCLDIALGVRVEKTLGGIREEARQIVNTTQTTGLSKPELLRMKIQECLVETEKFDFLSMGRSEGPGCYCYANSVLSAAIGELAKTYPWIVIDNEAGLENLSRRIVQEVDWLVMVSEWTAAGLRTAARLKDLASEMKVAHRKLVLIANRVPDSVSLDEIASAAQSLGAAAFARLGIDPKLSRLGETGGSLLQIASSSISVPKIESLFHELTSNPV